MQHLNLRLLVTIVAIGSLWSCAFPFHLKASVNAEKTRTGNFTLTYHPWDKMLNEYGRGVESVRQEIKQVSKDQISGIWDRAHTEAAINYIEASGLIPAECTSGIQGVRSRQFEGGWGNTDFRCN